MGQPCQSFTSDNPAKHFLYLCCIHQPFFFFKQKNVASHLYRGCVYKHQSNLGQATQQSIIQPLRHKYDQYHTLQATNSCAVEDATCLALEISLSSEPAPCTSALAASTSECAAAATSRAAEIRPSDHCPSSDEDVGRRATLPCGEKGRYKMQILKHNQSRNF